MLCGRLAAEPFDVHRDGREYVLHVGFWLSAVAAAAHAVSVGEFVDGALYAGAHCVAGLPFRCLLFGADADLQVAEFAWGEAHVAGIAGLRAPGAVGAGLALALGEPCHDQGGRGGRGGRVGAVPAGADLAVGAGDLLSVEVDVEVVAVEALVPAVLPGGVAG